MLIEHWTWFYHDNPTMHEDEDEEFDLEAAKAETEDPEAWEDVR